jgi:hypothetical protein
MLSGPIDAFESVYILELALSYTPNDSIEILLSPAILLSLFIYSVLFLESTFLWDYLALMDSV